MASVAFAFGILITMGGGVSLLICVGLVWMSLASKTNSNITLTVTGPLADMVDGPVWKKGMVTGSVVGFAAFLATLFGIFLMTI